MKDRAGRGSAQSRSVAFVYGGIAGALLMAIAVVALVVVPPSPPSIAEFAPSAEETIEESLAQQSSRFGAGEGGECAAGQAECIGPDGAPITTTTTAPPEPGRREIIKARVRRCVGDPPRQTEDPQSPPCLNYWEGDNGGATTKGVTRDEIRIGWACGFCCPREERIPEVEAVLEHFNRRYELYGRKFRLQFTTVGTQTQNNDPKVQQAAGERIGREFRSFAALDPGETTSDATAYFDALVREKVISLTAASAGLTEEDLRRRSPYQWTYAPTIDELGRATSSLACRYLRGRPPAYTESGPLPRNRKFAIIRWAETSRPLSVDAVERGLRSCDADLYASVTLPSADAEEPARRAALADLEANGVTTAICVCQRAPFTLIMKSASGANFRPEWLMPGTPGSMSDGITNYQTTAPADQRIHMFGLWPEIRLTADSESPWYAAIREGGPDVPASDPYSVQSRAYYQMLIVASGVQAAGPNLTPETFAAALRKLKFPNPNAGGPPLYQPSFGFGPGDHSMVDDVALHWWDETADSVGQGRNPRGAFCFVGQGRRVRLDRPIDPEPRFFDRSQPCR